MIGWDWNKTDVSPADIISGASTIPLSTTWLQADLASEWTPAARYVGWASDAAKQHTEFGSDAAVSYAKRAVCRIIDTLIVQSHLAHLAKTTYPEKIDLLDFAGLHVPNVIHDIIIDPRNEVEHEYREPTLTEAKHAAQLAGLFFEATSEQASHAAIISLGEPPIWERIDANQRRHTAESPFTLEEGDPPILLIDVTAKDHRALILRPADHELYGCDIKVFTKAETIQLLQLLRANREQQRRNAMTFFDFKLRELHRELKL